MSSNGRAVTVRAPLPSLRKSAGALATSGQRTRDSTMDIVAVQGDRLSKLGKGGTEAEAKTPSVVANTLRSGRFSTLTSTTPAAPPAAPPRAHAGTNDEVFIDALVGADLATTKVTAEKYYSMYKEATAENGKLRAALQQQEVDSVQVVQFLENRLKEVETEAHAYKDGVAQLLDEHRRTEETLQSQYSDMVLERDVELSRYASVTTKLHDDLRQASRYIQQRQEHTVELQELQAQLEEMVVAHEKEVAELHFQTVDRKLKLIALEKTMRAEFDALVEARAARALEERFQNVLERTRQLEEEKASMTHDIQHLMQLTTNIDAERVQMRRQVAVQEKAHKDLVHAAVARGKQKEQADLKIYQLETRVRELTTQLQTVQSEVQASYQRRIDALEAELKSTRISLQAHRTELQQMRQLSARVVSERSDLENFFHTALADCHRYRQGIAASSQATLGTMAANTAQLTERVDWGAVKDSSGAATRTALLDTVTTTPAVASPVPSLSGTLKGKEAYFEELPWKDKEKVIKSLLFFVNANYLKTPSVGAGALPESSHAVT